MSVLFRKPEMRAIGGTWSGGWVGDSTVVTSKSMESGLRLAPVYSAVSLVADAFSSLPCKAYRRTTSGRVELDSQPMLVTDPGPGRIDPVTWRHQALVSLLLRGNAVGLIVARDRLQIATKIVWLNPDWVHVSSSIGSDPQYTYLGQELPRADVVHISAFTKPGEVWGLSPLSLFRMQIEGGLEAVGQQRRWWRNPQPPAMVKNTAKKLDRTEAQAAKASWMASMKAGEPWFAGSDWDYSALTVSNADARFVESMKATATQIAAIYHVPPEDIGGETGSSMTYQTVEMNGIKFSQRAVLPWTIRFESVLSRLLLPDQYLRFNLDVLARTDLQGRMVAYQRALAIGVLTNPEARALEDRQPLTDEELASWRENYRNMTAIPQGGPSNG